jgi:heat shock protein HslJ
MISRIILFSICCLLQTTAYSQPIATTASNLPDDERAPLFSRSWNLIELNGVSTLQPGVKQAYLTFQRGEFNFNRMSGFTGCNYISGKIDLLDDDGIAFHPEPITNNNCHGSTVEANLLQTLLNADSWSEKNGQLLLERKGKVIARWSPVVYTNKALAGAWQLGYVSDLGAPFEEVFPDEKYPVIVFMEQQNRVTGYSGCHEFKSHFVINHNTIVFTENTPCDSTCHANEKNVFLSRLSGINGYVFKDDKTLVLIDDARPVMAFTRMKMPVTSQAAMARE